MWVPSSSLNCYTKMSKVVIIDDEVAIRETIAEILESVGFEVALAGSGAEGLELIARSKPEAVLCDVMMPGMTGIDVLKQMRLHPEVGATPFLFISAKNDLEGIRSAMNLGADDYIVKPFKTQELVLAIRAKVSRYREIKRKLETQISDLPAHFSKYGFHEFNTPMTALLAGFDFLLDFGHELSEEERLALFKEMRVSAMRMKRTYTNLMLYVKLLRNESVYSFNYTCCLKEAYQKVLHRLKAVYAKIPSDALPVSSRVKVREEALELLLYEVIDNALKFGDKEKLPEITTKMSADGKFCHFRVRDFGPGLSPAEIEAIGPMVQFNRPEREQQGWGLGLYLVKALCEANALGFNIHSTEQGTTVSIDFPLS